MIFKLYSIDESWYRNTVPAAAKLAVVVCGYDYINTLYGSPDPPDPRYSIVKQISPPHARPDQCASRPQRNRRARYCAQNAYYTKRRTRPCPNSRQKVHADHGNIVSIFLKDINLAPQSGPIPRRRALYIMLPCV